MGAHAKAFTAGPFNFGFNNGAPQPQKQVTPASPDDLSYSEFAKTLQALRDRNATYDKALDDARRAAATAAGYEFGTGKELPVADEVTRAAAEARVKKAFEEAEKYSAAIYKEDHALAEKYPGFYHFWLQGREGSDPEAANNAAQIAYDNALKARGEARDRLFAKTEPVRRSAYAALRQAREAYAAASAGTDAVAKERTTSDLAAKQKAYDDALDASNKANAENSRAFDEEATAGAELFDTLISRVVKGELPVTPKPPVKAKRRDPLEPVAKLVDSLNPLGGHFDPAGGLTHFVDSLNPAAKKKPAAVTPAKADDKTGTKDTRVKTATDEDALAKTATEKDAPVKTGAAKDTASKPASKDEKKKSDVKDSTSSDSDS